MEKAKLIDMVTGITCEGENISFDDFLIQMSGSGEIYDGYIGELISVATTGDVEWHEVCDYFVPIVREVLLEAIQEDDKAIFIGLAESIIFAWNRLKAKQNALKEADREFIFNEETPDLAHVVENLFHNLNEGWEIKETVFCAAGNTRVVISKKDKEVWAHESQQACNMVSR
ncbi:hypothetical protein E8L90_03235 [Brevibacillus antibioticus]|uniref:Uncharacterized protein n=1 Tax=Brevibacillus antibioticus TaxID=2570228 RepID=A0A4U2Y397_9BACL|nr:hypothetical protein [Brevibacillus antibioticus]TKI54534.1 hypothetical protein E8L90_03235 [Brevibacillus antibioticus]